MARHNRYFLPDQPLHLIQRGNNREPIFFGEDDYRRYRMWLGEAAEQYGCSIHAYVLMTAHAHGAADALVTDHPLYHALGRRAAEREEAYRALFDMPLDHDVVDTLRPVTNGSWVMGSERFKRKVAKALGRRVTPAAPGRPPAGRDDAHQRQLNLL
jgi:hypothetical protein